MAVPVRSELIANVDQLGGRLAAAALRRIEAGRRELSAAARAMPRADDLFAMSRRVFDELANRLGLALLANARVHRTQFERAAARLSTAGLDRLTERAGERLAALARRKDVAVHRRVEQARTRLAAAARLLEAVSYRSVLERGFALVSDAEGTPVRSATAAPAGTHLDIEFHDGHVSAVASGAAPPRRRRRARDDGSQGSLL